MANHSIKRSKSIVTKTSNKKEHLLSNFLSPGPLAILRLTEDEVDALSASRNGLNEFTYVLPHSLLDSVRAPCACLIFGREPAPPREGRRTRPFARLALLQSCSAVATLATRLKFVRSTKVQPASETALLRLLVEGRYANSYKSRISQKLRFEKLPPKLSESILQAVASDEANHWALRSVMLGLRKPVENSIDAQEIDALQMALHAFGLEADALATQLRVSKQSDSVLANLRIMEDAVIEHDARVVPGYELLSSDISGVATFRKGGQTLEVYTANRRRLEEAFGVDLIYLNTFHENAVMVQYKMLEPHGADEVKDWVYREDKHLQKQLAAMEKFAAPNQRSSEFRLCSDAFYFKFARRYGEKSTGNVLLPLRHFKHLLQNSKFSGRAGKLKIGYQALEGNYLRQSTFFGLLQSGYIGSHAETTKHLRALIDAVRMVDSSLVVAVQRPTTEEETQSDREKQLERLDNEHDEFFNDTH